MKLLYDVVQVLESSNYCKSWVINYVHMPKCTVPFMELGTVWLMITGDLFAGFVQIHKYNGTTSAMVNPMRVQNLGSAPRLFNGYIHMSVSYVCVCVCISAYFYVDFVRGIQVNFTLTPVQSWCFKLINTNLPQLKHASFNIGWVNKLGKYFQFSSLPAL